MTRRTLIQVQKAEPTQEEEIEGEEEAGLVVDVGTIPGVVVEEVREIHHRVEAQAAHTGAHNQMAAEEEDVGASSRAGTQEADMAMTNRGVAVEAVVGVEEMRM